jgi:hypothetical protein
MSDQFFYGGVWRAQTGRMKFIGGAWRTATRRKMFMGGVWRSSPTSTYTSPLSASASGDVSGNVDSPFSVVVTSDPATVTPSGGLAPYTYSWATPGMAATAPTSATTQFYKTLAHDAEYVNDAVCTVTDSLGAHTTATVGVDLTNRG